MKFRHGWNPGTANVGVTPKNNQPARCAGVLSGYSPGQHPNVS